MLRTEKTGPVHRGRHAGFVLAALVGACVLILPEVRAQAVHVLSGVSKFDPYSDCNDPESPVLQTVYTLVSSDLQPLLELDCQFGSVQAMDVGPDGDIYVVTKRFFENGDCPDCPPDDPGCECTGGYLLKNGDAIAVIGSKELVDVAVAPNGAVHVLSSVSTFNPYSDCNDPESPVLQTVYTLVGSELQPLLELDCQFGSVQAMDVGPEGDIYVVTKRFFENGDCPDCPPDDPGCECTGGYLLKNGDAIAVIGSKELVDVAVAPNGAVHVLSSVSTFDPYSDCNDPESPVLQTVYTLVGSELQPLLELDCQFGSAQAMDFGPGGDIYVVTKRFFENGDCPDCPPDDPGCECTGGYLLKNGDAIAVIGSKELVDVAVDAPQPPILLVHGIYSDDSIWTQVEQALTAADPSRPVFRVGEVLGQKGLVPNNGDINQLKLQLSKALLSVESITGASKVDIIAHSMGGLVARAYIDDEPLYRKDVRRLTMLGTPNQGAPIAKGLIASYFGSNGDDSFDTARYQMIPNSFFLNVLNQGYSTNGVEHVSIAGTFTNPLILLVQPTYWDKITDSIVPRDSSAFAGSCSQSPVAHTMQLGVAYYTAPPVISALVAPPQAVLSDCPAALSTSTSSVQTLMVDGVIAQDEFQTPIARTPLGNHCGALLAWPAGTLDLSLLSPSGQLINSRTWTNFPDITYSTGQGFGSTYAYFQLDAPEPGGWNVSVEWVDGATPLDYTLELFMDKGNSLELALDKSAYVPGDAAVITARLEAEGLPVIQANVTGTVETPEGVHLPVSLQDDGLHGDGEPADGLYGADYLMVSAGPHIFDIHAVAPKADLDIKNQIAGFAQAVPDLQIDAVDIQLSDMTPTVGEAVLLSAAVHNIGTGAVSGAMIQFWDGDPVTGGSLIEDVPISVATGGSNSVSTTWSGTIGAHEIVVQPKPENSFLDFDYANEKASITVVVTAPFAVATGDAPQAEVGFQYLLDLQPSGGVPPYSASLSKGALPPGLVLGTTGIIQGIPTKTKTYKFTVHVTDSADGSVTRDVKVKVIKGLQLKTTALKAGEHGKKYKASVSVKAGSKPYVWQLTSGSLPSGLSLDMSKGTVSGTPSAVGTFPIVMRITDALGVELTLSTDIAIAKTLTIKTKSLPAKSLGKTFKSTLKATGGIKPYSWSIIAGLLPPGLTLDPTTGLVNGIPNALGTYPFTVWLTDASGDTAAMDLAISIK